LVATFVRLFLDAREAKFELTGWQKKVVDERVSLLLHRLGLRALRLDVTRLLASVALLLAPGIGAVARHVARLAAVVALSAVNAVACKSMLDKLI
jgi:hypothetical protein